MNTTTIAADFGVAADIEQRASAVLRAMGLSVADAVRLLLTRIANEGRFPFVDAATPQEGGQENWHEQVLSIGRRSGVTDEDVDALMQVIQELDEPLTDPKVFEE